MENEAKEEVQKEKEFVVQPKAPAKKEESKEYRKISQMGVDLLKDQIVYAEKKGNKEWAAECKAEVARREAKREAWLKSKKG